MPEFIGIAAFADGRDSIAPSFAQGYKDAIEPVSQTFIFINFALQDLIHLGFLMTMFGAFRRYGSRGGTEELEKFLNPLKDLIHYTGDIGNRNIRNRKAVIEAILQKGYKEGQFDLPAITNHHSEVAENEENFLFNIKGLQQDFHFQADRIEAFADAVNRFRYFMEVAADKAGVKDHEETHKIRHLLDDIQQALEKYDEDKDLSKLQQTLENNLQLAILEQRRLTGQGALLESATGK